VGDRHLLTFFVIPLRCVADRHSDGWSNVVDSHGLAETYKKMKFAMVDICTG